MPDLTNKFGPEDKFLSVQYAGTTALVFVDLDIVGTLYTSTDEGSTWIKQTITPLACPDPTQGLAPLVPRDSGYSVGIVKNNVTGDDRLVVLGGDNFATNNVYYADAPYTTWACYDGDQVWAARNFAPMFTVPGVASLWMGGGIVVSGIQQAFSVGLFQSDPAGNGIAWQRPPCAAPPCPFPYNVSGDPRISWVLPFTPILPGQIANDWTTA